MEYGGLLFALISILVIWLLIFSITFSSGQPDSSDDEYTAQQKLETLDYFLTILSFAALAAAGLFFLIMGPAAELLAYLRTHWLFSLFAALCLIVVAYLYIKNIAAYIISIALILTFIQIVVNNDLLTISVALSTIIATSYLRARKRKRENAHKVTPWRPNVITKNSKKSNTENN